MRDHTKFKKLLVNISELTSKCNERTQVCTLNYLPVHEKNCIKIVWISEACRNKH